MELRELLNDDTAVSPVIGVILMVAITVILAAVIGTFVLGLGDQVAQSQPSANVGMQYSNISDATADNDAVTLTHKGGDKLAGSTLSVKIASTTVFEDGLVDGDTGTTGIQAGPLGETDLRTTAPNNWNDSSITAGDELVISEVAGSTNDVFGNGDTIRVIWSADSGDTAVVAEGTVQ